jgi:putative membrane protein
MDAEFPGINGFLGTRASIMLDIVFLAMFAVVPVMAWSINLAKHGKFQLHKTVQLALGSVLLVAVLLFELDMRFVTDWAARAKPSPHFASLVYPSLYVHLFFAVPTAFIWIYVIVQALRKFPSPPRPNEYSAAHRRWGKLAAIEMFMTAVTGWIFYYLAFIAS